MVPVATGDILSNIRSSFRERDAAPNGKTLGDGMRSSMRSDRAPTEASSNPTSDPSAFHRLSQMTRQATSSDGGSGSTLSHPYPAQALQRRPDMNLKSTIHVQHANNEQHAQHTQQRLQLMSTATAATTSVDEAPSCPSSGSTPNPDGHLGPGFRARDSRLPIHSCSGSILKQLRTAAFCSPALSHHRFCSIFDT